jgi:hypothetical protein
VKEVGGKLLKIRSAELSEMRLSLHKPKRYYVDARVGEEIAHGEGRRARHEQQIIFEETKEGKPLPVPGLRKIIVSGLPIGYQAVAVARTHACAIASDGSLSC